MSSPTLQEIVEEIDTEIYRVGETLDDYVKIIKSTRVLIRQSQTELRQLKAQKQAILKRIDKEENERSLEKV